MADEIDARPPAHQRLLNEVTQLFLEPRKFTATYLSTNSTTIPPPLASLLDIDEARLSETARTVIRAIETVEQETSSPTAITWTGFLWKLAAFQCLQDIFDSPLHSAEGDLRHLFQQYYFYYESRQLLAESILCGLNGFPTAAKVLLRPFLEFTALQHYYRHRINTGSSYRPLAEYFRTQRHPSWNTVIRNALPGDAFSKPIRYRLLAHLRGLSTSATHPYHPDVAIGQYPKTESGFSLEGLYFWYTAAMVLDAALWTYYANYPLLFLPIDVTSKFGFNGPVGLLIHKHDAHLIKQSLAPNDFEEFVSYARGREDAMHMHEWATSRPDLADSEIQQTWSENDDGPFPGVARGEAMKMAKLRALRVATAVPRCSDDDEDIPEFLKKAVHSLDGWKRLTKIRRKGV